MTGRVDLAMLYDPPPGPQLTYESIFREDLVLVAARSRQPRLPARVPVARLREYPLILPSPPNAIRALVESVCRAHGAHLQIAAEVDAVHTIVELAEQGHACAILPRSAVRGPEPRPGLAVAAIESPRIRNDLVLATPRNRPSTRLAQATAALIRQLDLEALFKPLRA